MSQKTYKTIKEIHKNKTGPLDLSKSGNLIMK